MKYRFMIEHRAEYPITLMCRVLRVARAGFYDYRVAQFDELTDGLRGGGDARFSW